MALLLRDPFPFPFLAFSRFFSSLSPIPHSPSAFPLFQFLFTLLSKFFSSFARATFLLSVSRPYLAFRVCYPVLFTLDSQRTRLYLVQPTFHRLFSNRGRYRALTFSSWTFPIQFPRQSFGFLGQSISSTAHR